MWLVLLIPNSLAGARPAACRNRCNLLQHRVLSCPTSAAGTTPKECLWLRGDIPWLQEYGQLYVAVLHQRQEASPWRVLGHS